MKNKSTFKTLSTLFLLLISSSLFAQTLPRAPLPPNKARMAQTRSAAIPKIPRQANQDVIIAGGNPNLLIRTQSKEEYQSQIDLALTGTLRQGNASKVTKDDPPVKIPYNLSIELKRPKKDPGTRSQPTNVALLCLVSDDGCNVSINQKGWLSESGSGHDISAGQRNYTELLPSGEKHTLDIEYSQVYYDPQEGEEDLDGISMILRSVPIDISVRKKGDQASMNNRILIQKGSTVEFAIHPDFFGKDADPQIDDFITWEYNKVNGQGSLNGWTPCQDTTGATASYTFEHGGIYQIRAKVGKEYFMYERRKTEAFCYENRHLYTGAPDYVGVTEFVYGITVPRQAFTCMGSEKYAKAAEFNDDIGYGVFPNLRDYEGKWKCNIFVFIQANSQSAVVPVVTRNLVERIPPVVDLWKDPIHDMSSDKGTWCWFEPNGVEGEPQPGDVLLGNAHCGVSDYDAAWINAGIENVNKKVHILAPNIADYKEDKEDQERYLKDLDVWKINYKLRILRQFQPKN